MSKKKKILFFSNTFWYLFNFRTNLITEFKKNYEIFCVSKDDEYSKKLQNLGCTVINIDIKARGTNPFTEFLLLIKFISILCKVKPAIVLNFTIKNNIYGSLACKFLNIPCVNNISGLGSTFINQNFLNKFIKFLYKISQKYPAKIFCQNSQDFKLLIDLNLVPPEKLEISYGSGINIKNFSKYRIAHKSDNIFSFLFIGRVMREKGVLELEEAFKNIFFDYPNTQLIMCGEIISDNKDSISKEHYLQLQKHNIFFLDKVKDVRPFLSEAHCVVLPSYREGFPKSLLEAAAFSLPIIACDVPGCNEIVINGYNGLLCAPRDSNSLQWAMEEILKMEKSHRDTLGRNSLLHAKNFDEALIIKQYNKVIDQILVRNLEDFDNHSI